MNFCHGSPGSIPALIAASDVFPFHRARLLSMAERIGDIIWKEGLVKKGNGLCHGISGNGYMMHLLYRKFDELQSIETSK